MQFSWYKLSLVTIFLVELNNKKLPNARDLYSQPVNNRLKNQHLPSASVPRRPSCLQPTCVDQESVFSPPRKEWSIAGCVWAFSAAETKRNINTNRIKIHIYITSPALAPSMTEHYQGPRAVNKWNASLLFQWSMTRKKASAALI